MERGVTERRPLHVVYLLADTALFGGMKVLLHQANLLHQRGHRVLALAEGERPDWFPVEAPFETVSKHEPSRVPECDVCIATFWPTIRVAAAAPCRQAVHFCQGYEGDFLHNRDEHGDIEREYRTPLPAMVVSPHLAEFLRSRFGREARVVPQPLEPFWRPRWRWGPQRVPRILVPSPFEIEWKGVTTGLRAVERLRGERELRLIRLSQWPLSEAEREIAEPDEYHHHLHPPEVARLMAGCDLLLAPSWEQEGFGLLVLEAMACGLPVVASDVPSYRGFAAEAARLVPPRKPDAFAAAAAEILGSRRLWRRLRKTGLATAARFTEERSAQAAEDALYWALGKEGSLPD